MEEDHCRYRWEILGKTAGLMDEFVKDAVGKGATVALGGERLGGKGNFYAPTVLRDVPDTARVNHTAVHEAETPFGDVNESGYGAESGLEGLEAYLRTKMITEKRV